ncbi:zinc-ribbon domain-containing protein [Paraburkholderia hospita]|uniref:zinc-ribbon domain-containing protein n=1 Tax=Paraburkholderia hospita TaxID=169430 RepID=UPI0009D955D0|nr:hypothetical protein CA603_33465 [Paraburkholderia hospita]OUL80325.1 hypothetical protein CA601_32730 [Paraburkholderia hospita]OUL91369.1 hypothetical protein CA602_05300 [Paraburkholderia hospita]
MKTFQCSSCYRPVLFESNHCEGCGTFLGFIAETGEMSAFRDLGDGRWQRPGALGFTVDAVERCRSGRIIDATPASHLTS